MGQVREFAFGINLVNNFDTELDKVIKILVYRFVEKGLCELSIEGPLEVGDLGARIQVQDCGK